MDWPRFRRAADLSTLPTSHQPKQMEEPPPGGCDTRVLGFSRDVGKMVKKWMKHDETIKHGGKNGWFHSFGESVREDVETWSTKWMKASKVLEK